MSMAVSISNENFLGKYPSYFILQETRCFPNYLSSPLLWCKGKRKDPLWAFATNY